MNQWLPAWLDRCLHQVMTWCLGSSLRKWRDKIAWSQRSIQQIEELAKHHQLINTYRQAQTVVQQWQGTTLGEWWVRSRWQQGRIQQLEQQLATWEPLAEQEYQAAFDRAYWLATEGRFSEAIALFESVQTNFYQPQGEALLHLLRQVMSGRSAFQLGLLAEQAQQFEAASHHYQAAIAVAPEWEQECRLRLGIVALKTGQSSTAWNSIQGIPGEPAEAMRKWLVTQSYAASRKEAVTHSPTATPIASPERNSTASEPDDLSPAPVEVSAPSGETITVGETEAATTLASGSIAAPSQERLQRIQLADQTYRAMEQVIAAAVEQQDWEQAASLSRQLLQLWQQDERQQNQQPQIEQHTEQHTEQQNQQQNQHENIYNHSNDESLAKPSDRTHFDYQYFGIRIAENLQHHILPSLETVLWQQQDWRQLVTLTEQRWLECLDMTTLHNWMVATYAQALIDLNYLNHFIVAAATTLANLHSDPTLQSVSWLDDQPIDYAQVAIGLQEKIDFLVNQLENATRNEQEQITISFADTHELYHLERKALALMGTPPSRGLRVRGLFLTPGCYQRYSQKLQVPPLPKQLWSTLYTPWGAAVLACLEGDVFKATRVKPDSQAGAESSHPEAEQFAKTFVAYHEGCYYLQLQPGGYPRWRSAMAPLKLAKSAIRQSPDWSQAIDHLCQTHYSALWSPSDRYEFAKFWCQLTDSSISQQYLNQAISRL